MFYNIRPYKIITQHIRNFVMPKARKPWGWCPRSAANGENTGKTLRNIAMFRPSHFDWDFSLT